MPPSLPPALLRWTLCCSTLGLGAACNSPGQGTAAPTHTATRTNGDPSLPSDGGVEPSTLPDGGQGDSHSPRAIPQADPPTVQSEPEALTALAGTYAARVVYQELQTLDVGLGISGTLLNTTTAYDLVTLEADGTYVETPCAVDITSEDGDGSSALFVTRVELNPDLFPMLAPFERRFETDGERFELPFASQAIGWRPTGSDPSREPLPTRAEDPRVVDDDGDGEPGVTTTLSGNVAANGDLYVVQLKRNRMFGNVRAEGLEGEVVDRGEQRVVGGTAAQANQSVVPAGDANTNRIDLVPVEASLDCATLLEEVEARFPPHPVQS